MPTVQLDSFLGYKPDLANPSPNSARSGKNFSIHRHRDYEGKITGWIEEAQGYSQKFSDGLPTNDTVIRKISNIAFNKDLHNLYIPEHGGQNVSVLLATYRKTGFFPGNPTIDRFGIWIRPFWNGSAWIDAWRELTEVFIFEILSIGTGGDSLKCYIDDGTTYDFDGIDPTGIVFNTNYFKNWTIVYLVFDDGNNYSLVTGSGYDGSSYYLSVNHLPSQLGWSAGGKFIVYRGFIPQELPSSVSSHIYGLLSEARVSSGNGASDVNLQIAYRNTSFVQGGANPYTRTVDEILAGPGTLNIWQYAGMVGIDPTPVPDAAGLAALTWHFKYSLVMDDGSETRLYDALTDPGGEPPQDWTAGAALTLTELSKIKLYIYRSHGAMPVRARFLRLYVASEQTWPKYYRTIDYDLRSATIWDNYGRRGYAIFGGWHWYARTDTGVFITGSDWTNKGAQAEAQIQRGMADTGIVQLKHASVIGNRTYGVGVRKDGILYPNIMFATATNGDGGRQYDVFVAVSTLNIDLEYGIIEGDELVASAPAGDRILAFKRRSLIVVTPQANGFTRDIITKSDGLCSARTIASHEDLTLYAGYFGVYMFSSRGWVLINADWLEEWKAVSTVNKEAAVGVFDVANRQYRLAYGAVERSYDLDSGEWTPAVLTHQPTKIAYNNRDGIVEFLSGSQIYTLGTQTLHAGGSFLVEHESNDFDLASQARIDVLLQYLRVRYDSSVDLTAQLYLDGAISGDAVTLPTTAKEQIIQAGLSARCKTFRLKVSGTITTAGQKIKVKKVTAAYELLPSGLT